jgi:hypothetical protein
LSSLFSTRSYFAACLPTHPINCSYVISPSSVYSKEHIVIR